MLISKTDRSQGLIYDVGAHKGEDTEFYLKKGFSVIAIEANPDLFSDLATKFEEFADSGRLILLNIAISEHAGETTFFINDRSDWGTTSPEWASRNEKLGSPSKPITVKSETFETVLRTYGVPYYLKIDIEGADLLCLHALRAFSERPQFVSIESEKVSWKKLIAEFSLLESLGYRSFKIIKQWRVPRQQPPYPPEEGIFCSHTFDVGSSGLFGKELPGVWISRKRATAKYLAIFARYKLFGDNTFGLKLIQKISKRFPIALRLRPSWYDTHARLELDLP